MRLAVLLIMLGAILIAGCTGTQSEEKTPTPQTTETPVISPSPEKTKTEELHGVGKCDQCHDAPTVSDMAAGLHKDAFEKQPEIHKRLCSDCHDVNTFCATCHEVPGIVKS